MKILLISGHGAGDPGACSQGYKEADITREIVNGIAPILRTYSTVHIYPQSRNAYKDIQNGQWQMGWDYDYVLEVHLNAGGGTGVEDYVTTKEKTITVESKIVNNVANIGLRNRGVKVTDFLVIRTCKNHGISSALLETFFIDSVSDMKLYQANKQKFFNAIALGVIQGFGLHGVAVKEPIKVPVQEKPEANIIGYTGNSLVDYLKSVGADSSYANREKLAKQYGIVGYAGASGQNMALLNAMRTKPVQVVQPKVEYYKAVNKNGLAPSLKSIGVDSSFAYRTKIANANGISKYSGSFEQNDKLASLLAKGMLKKV